MENTIRVGFARQTVTPDQAIALSGYGNEAERLHTTVSQPLCATCVAISDGEDSTVLLVSLDLYTLPEIINPAAVAEKVGIAADRIFLSATNTHSAPGKDASCENYFKKFFDTTVSVCTEALADRKAATMATAGIETEKLNYVKHYKCRDLADGHIFYAGAEYIKPALADYIEHATKADPTMHMVKFAREGGKDVVMANFRAKPTFDGGENKTVLSADYPGFFRTGLESIYDCHVAFFQGGAGNIDAQNRMHGGNRYGSAQGHGLALAGYAADCLARFLQPADANKVQINKETFQAQTKDGSVMDVPLSVITIGDRFGIATFPGEVYDSVSVRMEENSRYFSTMLLGYCNGYVGYLPSRVAYKYPAIETDLSPFAPGVGEKAADALDNLFWELKK